VREGEKSARGVRGEAHQDATRGETRISEILESGNDAPHMVRAH